MTSIELKCTDYLSNISHISRKIHHDIENVSKSYGEAWESFSLEKQEECLNDFFIDKETRVKYGCDTVNDSSASDDTPEVFPKYVVGCGEKIVIDFDNDGWTWRDEHSAPFSWMSGSQQDLTICWDEQDGEAKAETKKKKAVSPSPERTQHNSNLNFKPEKSIWQSPFLAADRGFDSSYLSSIQNYEENEVESSENKSENSVLHSENESGVDSLPQSPFHQTSTDTSMLLQTNNKQEQFGNTNEKCVNVSIPINNKKKDLPAKKSWTPLKLGKKGEDSYALMSEKNSDALSTPESSPARTANQTALTYSSTTPLESAAFENDLKPVSSFSSEAGSGGCDNLSVTEDSDGFDMFGKEEKQTDEADVKTGFDFLDNW